VGGALPLATDGTRYSICSHELSHHFGVIKRKDGAGGGGRTLTALRPRDFESDRKGTEIVGRSSK